MGHLYDQDGPSHRSFPDQFHAVDLTPRAGGMFLVDAGHFGRRVIVQGDAAFDQAAGIDSAQNDFLPDFDLVVGMPKIRAALTVLSEICQKR